MGLIGKGGGDGPQTLSIPAEAVVYPRLWTKDKDKICFNVLDFQL